MGQKGIVIFVILLLMLTVISCSLSVKTTDGSSESMISSEENTAPSETEKDNAAEPATSEPATVPDTSETGTAEGSTEPSSGEETDPADLSGYSVQVALNEDSDFAFSRDSEGNLYGAKEFCIDGRSTYILSTSSNTITEFQEGEAVRKISFQEEGWNVVQFAVKGDLAYAYTVNAAGSYIVKYIDWKPAATMSIYEFTSLDGFFDFYILEEDLYVVSSSDTTMDYMTCLIHQEGESLHCFDVKDGKLVEGTYTENVADVQAALEKETQKQAEKDGLVFEFQEGMADCGTDENGGHYYYSAEIVNDTEKEYYIQRIYHFDETETLLEVFTIPLGKIIDNPQPVKVFFGKVWVLYRTEDTVEVDLLEEIAKKHNFKEEMMEINWGLLNSN